MAQIIRVYNTRANAIAGGTTGMIASSTVDGNAGAISNTDDAIPYYIYQKYFYRIDANEPVSEFHIDWDDGEDNSDDKRNIQIIKLQTPRFFCVVEHVYTEACTEAKKFFPMIRVKGIDGYLSKWYTNDAAENKVESSTVAFEPYSNTIASGQNTSSMISFEKAGKDLIPHFCPSNMPPVAVLKADRKRIFSGIDNRAISKLSAVTHSYPLLYVYTTASSKPDVKLTFQGRDDRAIKTVTLDSTNIVTADADLDDPTGGTSGEFYTRAIPLGNQTGSGANKKDCVESLLRAELVNATTLGDTERVYIKVFDAVYGGGNDLTGNADVDSDATVCILSNGNPIVDLNEHSYSVNLDASESFTKASNLSIRNNYIDDDTLNNALIQSVASASSKIGQHTDLMHDDTKVVVTDGTYDINKLSYTNHTKGHLMDSDSRFYDFHRLVRLQVADNYSLPTGMGDIANRRSSIENFERTGRYNSTVDSGNLRMPTSLEFRGLLLYSNDDDYEEAYWQNLNTYRTNALMIGGSGTHLLRYAADTSGDSNTFTNHPKNHIFIARNNIFDRLYFRLDNTHALGASAPDIDITAMYAHPNGWKALEIEDSTLGLKTSGSIKWRVPPDWKALTQGSIESGSWSGPVPAASSEEHNTAEITEITLNSSDSRGAFRNEYITIPTAHPTASTKYVYWFQADGGQSQPTVSGATAYVEVDIQGYSTDEEFVDVLQPLINSGPDWSAIQKTATVISVTMDDGYATDPITTSASAPTISLNIATAGSSVANTNDPATQWDSEMFAVMININAKADSSAVEIKNIWPYNNSHSQLIKVTDPHHVSLNSIAIAQSIAFNRQGKHINMEDRFGKTEIRKIGASGGVITFGSIDLGDTDNSGNRKKMKNYQANATPVFLDITHKSGEITRFFGIITSMSEDHPVGLQYPKYAVKMQISHIIELDSSGNLISDKKSIGGNTSDTRQYISSA
tara:strand:- start:1207 stop:4107 length:2901 start_codon:yes stop_codon:yes gene_type:complete